MILKNHNILKVFPETIKNKTNTSKMDVEINLNERHSIFTIIQAFESYNYNEDLIISIRHNKNYFIAVSVYPVLCSIVNEARIKGYNVILNFELPSNCNQLMYAERMNFLDCLGIDYFNPFGRNKPNGRFIEILNIPANSYSMNINLMDVFQKDFNLSFTSAYDLSFIIGELYCNTTIHSKSLNGCYFYCQKYPSKNYLEMYIVDSGIGIVDSMRKNTKYNNVREKDLLLLSLDFAEGNGNGRGHGLYFVSEFIKRNDGEMLFISGNNHILVNDGNIYISENEFYRGVILKLKIKFNVNVTTTQLMKEKQYTNV